MANGAQIIGCDVELTCTVELHSAILPSEISLLMVSAELYKDGTPDPLALTGPNVSETTFTYTNQLISFERNDFGNYTCIATMKPQPSANLSHLTGTAVLSDTLRIKAGKFY